MVKQESDINIILGHLGCNSRLYLIGFTLVLFIAGLWPFNFTEKNNADISSIGGLEIARHGTAYTAAPAGKLQDLKQFAIYVDLVTSSDGLDSLEKIFGCFINQEDENFFLAKWKDGLELRVRTERNAAGMIFGEDGVLEKEKRAAFLISYNGQKMHFYKNGTLIRRDARGLRSFSNWDRTYPLVVGSDANGRSQWKGNLYQIAVWDRSLSTEAVAYYTRQSYEGCRGADSRRKISQEQQTTRQENPPVSPFAKGGESDGRPKNTKAVTSDQWPVTSEGEQQDKRPLIHYVFNQENTYETEFRGNKALGVRDLGKGEPADLVIPEHFMPYQRVYLGWDPDWMRNRSDWLDVAVNVIGFVPFGLLLTLAFRNGLRSVKCHVSSEDGKQPTATRQENPPVSPFMKGGGLVVAVVLAVMVGFGVSLAIELLQAYLPSRDSSLRDLVTNTAGTLFGALAAVSYSRMRATATSASAS